MAGLKMNGAEYKAFTTAEWGPDWYWDETVFLWNGKEVEDIDNEEVADTDQITIVEATIFKGSDMDSEAIDGVRFARNWLKAQTMARLLVEVPREKLEEVQTLLKSVKGVKVV